MLEDLVGDSMASIRETKRSEISIEIIIALIGLGIQIIKYCQSRNKTQVVDILANAKYPTLDVRFRLRRAMRKLKYTGDMDEAELVLFHAMRHSDLVDVKKAIEERVEWVS